MKNLFLNIAAALIVYAGSQFVMAQTPSAAKPPAPAAPVPAAPAPNAPAVAAPAAPQVPQVKQKTWDQMKKFEDENLALLTDHTRAMQKLQVNYVNTNSDNQIHDAKARSTLQKQVNPTAAIDMNQKVFAQISALEESINKKMKADNDAFGEKMKTENDTFQAKMKKRRGDFLK